MRYMFDTNVVSHLMKEPLGRIGQRIALSPGDQMCTSIIVVAEIRFGAARRQSSKLVRQIATVLEFLPVEAWGKPADAAYGHLRAVLEAAGTPIGSNDMLIAAQAIALDCILVTDNEGEFRRVPGLRVENWLRDA